MLVSTGGERMNSQEKSVVLVIADISGYTKFMISDETSLEHKQMILTHLMGAIVERVEPPLEISKLEGDAVFVYALKGDREPTWQATRKDLGARLIGMLKAFAAEVEEMANSAPCKCGACSNVDKLKLKIVVHSGEGFFVEVGGFNELSGVDVIVAHRLLKNSVQAAEYILMTQSGYQDVEFPKSLQVVEGEEEYDEIGKVKTYVYVPSLATQ
jgi:hypothetical protein